MAVDERVAILLADIEAAQSYKEACERMEALIDFLTPPGFDRTGPPLEWIWETREKFCR